MLPILIGASRHASAVAKSLARELSASGIACPLSRARETLARMFGHRDFHALSEASKGRPETLPDDMVGPAESASRRERYVTVLAAEMAIPPALAARIVDAVRPTGLRVARAEANAFPSLDGAILDGATVRAFRSGGGLRVIRVERGAQGSKLIGYGEAPHIGDALRHADEDTAAGGRPYGDVYGKLVPHYLTGAAPEGDPLDAWVHQGHGMRAKRVRGSVLVRLMGSRETAMPEEVYERALATGEPVEWETRGMRYRATATGQARFVSYQCLEPDLRGRDPYRADVVREASAGSLARALAEAIVAPEREIIPQRA